MALRALAVLCCLLLTGCFLYPPADGVSTANGGVAEVMQRYHVEPLDPTRPLLQQALEEIEKTDPFRAFRGVTYGLTEGNRLPPDWLLATPGYWGRRAADLPVVPLDCPGCDPDLQLPPCPAAAACAADCPPLAASVRRPGDRPVRFCLGHSDRLIDVIYQTIVTAEQAVDITLLQPPPDVRFLAGLRNAITRLAHTGRAIRMRVLVGDYPPEGTDALGFLHALVRDAHAVPESQLTLQVGAMRSCNNAPPCNSFSWNHAKIVAVDGRQAIVGGHNPWTRDDLLADPTHDVSMQVMGPAVRQAHRFADAMWRVLCHHRDADNLVFFDQPGRPVPDADCEDEVRLPPERPLSGGVPILAVGRLASGIVPAFADHSQIARDLMFGAATRTIRLVQQDVAFSFLNGLDHAWPDSAIERMADLLTAKGGDVYLVLSNLGAAGPTGDYSNGVSPETVARRIADAAAQRSGRPPAELAALLCRHLHVASYRFGPDQAWPDGRPFGVHAKVWMVDDRAFYIGSENLYPVDLQEFGYIVEDAAAARTLRQDYWDQIWRWSQAAAISGGEAKRCVLAPDGGPPA